MLASLRSVRLLGLSHIQLANALRHLIRLAEEERSRQGWGPSRPIRLCDIRPSALLQSVQQDQPQTFVVEKKFYIGFQHSIFANEALPDTDESTTKWKEEYALKDGNTVYFDTCMLLTVPFQRFDD